MEEASSPTDISSSLSEFVRRERIIKELYQENNDVPKPSDVAHLSYNDEEIDNILQQMGRLLSPAGQESDKIYKHVITETENKSIEQILNEAKELISDNTPVVDSASICICIDDLSSVSTETESDVTFINVEDSRDDTDYADDNYNSISFRTKLFSLPNNKHKLDAKNSKKMRPPLKKYTRLEFPTQLMNDEKRQQLNDDCRDSPKNANLLKEMKCLREEVQRVNQLYESCRMESADVRSEMSKLEHQWKQREKQLLQENCSLKQNIMSSVSHKEFESFQTKLNKSNETITHLKSNLNKINDDWRKKEVKLIHECDQLRRQLKGTSKFAQPDVEKLQEQLKDSQEMNVRLKLDSENCKDKCTTLENLCTDLKKVIMDEQIAEKVYADDNIPASVKQYLSSSSSSVINTLSHMFGCLSRSATRNRSYCGQKDKELFTTMESSMINDLSKSYEHSDLVKELLKEKEQMKKENLDLNRQVKEMEKIVHRRAHPNFSTVSEIIKSNESKMYEKESEAIKNLKKELLEKHHVIIDLKNDMVETKARYDQNLLSLQSKIVNIQEESMRMKEDLEKKKVVPTNHVAKCKRKGRSCDPPQHSVRNFRIELSAKEREIQLLNKQLEEVKKNNRRLVNRDKENYYLSSKEQSTEDIQLNRKFSMSARANEKTQHSNQKKETTETEVAVIDLQCPKQIIENGNYNYEEDAKLMSRNYEYENHENQFPDDENMHHTSNPNIPNNNNNNNNNNIHKNESKSQNLQKVFCDLLALLTKEELGDEIHNSNSNTYQQEELRRFVASLKSFSN